jgi:hypothetical protein
MAFVIPTVGPRKKRENLWCVGPTSTNSPELKTQRKEVYLIDCNQLYKFVLGAFLLRPLYFNMGPLVTYLLPETFLVS